MKNADEFEGTVETTQLQKVQQLPAEVSLIKMENDQIFAVARTSPREPMKIVKQLQELIDAYPQAAADAIYSKPVGTVIKVTCGHCGVIYETQKVTNETTCPSCNSGEVKEQRKVKKYAEGLSIRAAESIRSIYGYTRLAVSEEKLEDGSVKIAATMVDYAAGNITSDERIVSPVYKSWDGKMTRIPEDRFLNVTVKAEKSKLRRDLIMDNTPAIVKACFRDACEAKLDTLISKEQIEQKIIPAFTEYGITPQMLDKIIGRPAKLGWREEERLQCRKILTALKNDETTVRELMEGLGDAPAPKTPAGGGVSMDDLAKKPKTEAKAPEPQPAPTPAKEASEAKKSDPPAQPEPESGKTAPIGESKEPAKDAQQETPKADSAKTAEPEEFKVDPANAWESFILLARKAAPGVNPDVFTAACNRIALLNGWKGSLSKKADPEYLQKRIDAIRAGKFDWDKANFKR